VFFAETQLVNRISDNFNTTVVVEALVDFDANRVADDSSELGAEKVAKLIASADRSIGQLRTAKRALSHSTCESLRV